MQNEGVWQHLFPTLDLTPYKDLNIEHLDPNSQARKTDRHHLFYHRGHIRRVGGCVSVAICFHFVQGVRQLPQTQKYYPVFLSVAIQEIRRRNQVNYHSRKSRHIIFLGLMQLLIFVPCPCPVRSMFVDIGRSFLYYIIIYSYDVML